MKILSQLSILLCFSSVAFGYNVNFQIVKTTPATSAEVQRVKEGVNFFTELLKRDCKINLNTKFEIKSKISENVKFNFDESWVKFNDYNFRYFQKSLYDFTTQNSLSQPNNTVSLLMVKELTGRCGFAVPAIQLTDNESIRQNPNNEINRSVFHWIKNRILIAPPATSDSECGGSNRVIAHELSHIFIQDNPAHQCEDENTGTMKSCDEYNILATRRAVYPISNDGGFKRPPVHRPDDGMGAEPQYLPATGNSISTQQCKAIESTLKQMTF